MNERVIYRKTAKNSFGSFGGAHRTAQVAELVQAAGFALEDIPLWDAKRPFLKNCFAGMSLVKNRRFRARLSLSNVAMIGRHFLDLKQSLESLPNPRLLLWEHTNHSLVPYAANSLGIKTVAVPMDLASLSPDYRDHYTQSTGEQSLCCEIADLRNASEVFTISQEEHWMLGSLKVPCRWLPYFPPENLRKRMQRIREQRVQTSRREHLLLLGSAHHHPTRKGMYALANMLLSLNQKNRPTCVVVGQDTDKLDGPFDTPGFVKMGRISDEQLDDVMSRSIAMLVHQEAGPGCLTRIAEVLLAGLPVVANPIAARSYYGVDGVHVFHTPEELLRILGADLPEAPPMPRPLAMERVFQAALEQLHQSGKP